MQQELETMPKSNEASSNGPACSNRSAFLLFMKGLTIVQSILCAALAIYFIVVGISAEAAVNAKFARMFNAGASMPSFGGMMLKPLLSLGLSLLLLSPIPVAFASALQKLDAVARKKIASAAKEVCLGWEAFPLVMFILLLLLIGGGLVYNGISGAGGSVALISGLVVISLVAVPLCLSMLMSLSVKLFRTFGPSHGAVDPSAGQGSAASFIVIMTYILGGIYVIGVLYVLLMAGHMPVRMFGSDNKFITLLVVFCMLLPAWIVLGIASATHKLRKVALKMKEVGLGNCIVGWECVPFLLLAVFGVIDGIHAIAVERIPVKGVLGILNAAFPLCIGSLLGLAVKMFRQVCRPPADL